MKKVKKVVAAALVLTSILSVGIQGSYSVCAEAGVRQGIRIIGDGTGSVSLKGNPSTGYSWRYKIEDPSVVEVVSEEFVSDDKTGKFRGTGGTYTWKFAALKLGKTEVTFEYVSPGTNEVIESRTYVLRVDGDRNVSVDEKVGFSAEIKLQDNVSEENAWAYEITDKSIVKVSDPYFSYEPEKGDIIICYIDGLKEGETEVTFNSINKSTLEVEKSITYVVTVDSKLNVTAIEK